MYFYKLYLISIININILYSKLGIIDLDCIIINWRAIQSKK